MHRTRGKVIGVVVGIAATGLLAACGNNDSTATSTPTLSHTTTVAPTSASTSAAATGQPSQAPETPTDTATPERPQPVPTNAVPEDTSKLTDKDKKFLDALKAAGITPSTPDIALSIGSYVCQGVAANASDQDLMTFVSAMAGSDPSFDPAKMPVDKAGRIYIDTAKATYCQ
ncbi:DUF732 domain-containing protein [Nocardia anaemiae]|uniref:DUF732 domain-containing protein n=1 Tax=Nocardia anaemiae TaxID=263910 RepID=UPI0007A449B1|nr:DUF732 domain-containing protein [Nocardia anaemiae]